MNYFSFDVFLKDTANAPTATKPIANNMIGGASGKELGGLDESVPLAG